MADSGSTTTTSSTEGAVSTATPAAASDTVKVTIDGREFHLGKGTLLIDACNEAAGAEVPYFCYHPGLSRPAVCRQCLVEVKGQPKPVPACYTPIADGMEVFTKSEKALDVRRQMLEFTLVNHPIDCPICDKAGECMLQQHYFDWDGKYARNDGIKVRKRKVVDVGPHIVLDQERCILCTRCIRVCDEVAKQPQLTMANRGDREVLTTAPGQRLDNPYSLNTVDVCPVGALTSKDFRFSMRVWELSTMPSVCNGCATGCNIEVHSSRDHIHRLVPRANAAVNQHWMCDEGRFTYKEVHRARAAVPTVAGRPVAWDTALDEAATRLKGVLGAGPAGLGVVFNAGSSNEDLHVLARLAFDHLGVTNAYLAGRDQGWHDDILVSADKNPNTAGARAVAGTRLRTLLDLAGDLKAGKLTGLLVVGDTGVLGEGGLATLPVDRVENLIVLAWHDEALAQAAHVVLPLSMWAEADGTITNRTGLVQRLRRAVAPAGDCLPGWDILGHLARRLDVEMTYANARGVFEEARAKHAFMQGAEWGRPVLPIQLRFANSRG